MDKKSTVMYGDINIFNRSQRENDNTPESSQTSSMESPRPKRKAETATSATPEKRQKLTDLKQTIQLTVSDLDLYNTSAAYYFNRQNFKEGNEKIDKSKRLANSHLQRVLYLADGLEKEMVAKNQRIVSLEKNNFQLQQQFHAANKEKDLLKQKTIDLQQEIDEIKEDKELLSCDIYNRSSAKN